jgi:hypothetical protein
VQWQIEDAMLYGLEILEGLQARKRFERDAVGDAERTVAERLQQAQGR